MKTLIKARAFDDEGMYVLELLPGGRRKPKGLFVCLHGFPAWSSKNYDLAERLCLLGYAVLVPHYPGLGFSPGRFSFKQTVERIDGFLESARRKYRLPISLMGHSWGGYLAMTLGRHVDRCLLLLAPLSRFPVGKGLRKSVDILFSESSDDCRRYTKDSLFRELGILGQRLSLERLAAQMKSKKVLIIHGRSDSVIPIKTSRALAAGLQGRAGLLELDDGHLLFRNRPQVLAHVARWLKADRPRP